MNIFAQRGESSTIFEIWNSGGAIFSRYRRAAFSLVEMLAVIGVIGLIAATTTPMLFSTMKANRLTAAGEEMMNRISLAQQMAVSRNHEVELRFYHFADPEDTTAGDHYRATLIVEPAPDPAAPTVIAHKVLSEMSYLRGGIVIANDPNLSPPFAESSREDNADTDTYIRNATAKYKAIRFFPDGSCDLTVITNESYMTVVDAREFENVKSTPKNFFAIQVDHYTSRVTPYRP